LRNWVRRFTSSIRLPGFQTPDENFILKSLRRMAMTRLEKLQGMLQDSPEDLFLNYALAMEHVSGGRKDDALAAFRRVLTIDPNHSAAWFQQAQLLAGAGDVAGARESATRGVAAAKVQGDQHAVEEIGGFLESLPQ
jgi:Flp pilus assembly protein TadD